MSVWFEKIPVDCPGTVTIISSLQELSKHNIISVTPAAYTLTAYAPPSTLSATVDIGDPSLDTDPDVSFGPSWRDQGFEIRDGSRIKSQKLFNDQRLESQRVRELQLSKATKAGCTF